MEKDNKIQKNTNTAAPEKVDEIIPDAETKGNRKTAQKLSEDLKKNQIFENSKGEFFTEYSYAVSSEAGVKENVITHQF